MRSSHDVECRSQDFSTDLPPLPTLKPEAFAASLGEKAPELFQQVQSIQLLELDQTTLVLVLVIALFSTPEVAENMDLIRTTQNNLRHLLYRYLCTKMSRIGALQKMERIEIILNLLMNSDVVLA